MLGRIEAKKAYSRFEVALRKYNNDCPTESTTRTRMGQTIEVIRKVGTIKQAVKETFYVILSQYIHRYNFVASNMPAGMYSPSDLPSLLTNSVRLADLCSCTDRTVRNHIGKLKSLGIVRTKFHGRQKDYELWITPEILFGGEGENFQKPALELPIDQIRKNFPLKYTHREIIEKGNGSADMCVEHGENNHGERGRTDEGPLPLADGQESPEWAAQREENLGAGRAAIVAQKTAMRLSKANQLLDERNPQLPRGLDERYLNMLVEFWLYAWKVIYPEREFTKEQQEKALIAIAAGVYNSFQDSRTDKDWIDFQMLQLTKLDKAARFYENHPDAYLPDPYSVHVPGKGYFDKENLKGFVGINAWIKRESIQKAINRDNYQLAKDKRIRYYEGQLKVARRDFEKLKAGQPARKGMENMSLTELYHHWLTVFKGLGGDWEAKFNQQYVDQHARNFAPPKVHRTRRMRQLADKPSSEVVVYVQDWMTWDEGYYSE